MELRLEKCAIHIKKGVKRRMRKGTELPNQYKNQNAQGKGNLGILEADTTKQMEMKEKLKENSSRERENNSKANYIEEISSKR